MFKNNTIILILAAGASARMGVSKWELPFSSDKTFLQHLIHVYLEAGFSQIGVIMNPNGARHFKSQTNSKRCSLVINRDPDSGRNHSIAIGLEAFADFDFAFIQNVDNPFVTPQLLIEIWNNRLTDGYVVPEYDGQQGHPVLLAQSLCSDFKKQLSPEFHFRNWLHTFKKKTIRSASPSILLNINSPEDYQRATTTHRLKTVEKSTPRN